MLIDGADSWKPTWRSFPFKVCRSQSFARARVVVLVLIGCFEQNAGCDDVLPTMDGIDGAAIVFCRPLHAPQGCHHFLLFTAVMNSSFLIAAALGRCQSDRRPAVVRPTTRVV